MLDGVPSLGVSRPARAAGASPGSNLCIGIASVGDVDSGGAVVIAATADAGNVPDVAESADRVRPWCLWLFGAPRDLDERTESPRVALRRTTAAPIAPEAC